MIDKRMSLILLLLIVIAITSCSKNDLVEESISSINTVIGVGVGEELFDEESLLYEQEQEGGVGVGNPYFLIKNITGVEIFKVEHTGNTYINYDLIINGSVLLDDDINITGNITSVDCIHFDNGAKIGNCE